MSSYNPALFESLNAPEPMAPLKNVIITPENVAAEARLNRAKPLSKRQIKTLEREAKALEAKANKLGTARDKEMSLFLEIRAILETLAARREELRPRVEAAPDDEALQAEWEAVWEQGNRLNAEYIPLRNKLRTLIDLEKRVAAIRQQIADNPKVVARKLEEDRISALQHKEARTYEEFIINRLTKLGYCYRSKDRNGNEILQEVKFVWCDITPDAIYYKIDVARGTMFGGWRDMLPHGVRVADLVKDETCYELSQSCGRQVTSKVTPINGAWIIVHRLDTNDGLVNKVRYRSVMDLYPRTDHKRVPICMGVGHGLNIKWLYLTEYPHLLVAGFTGSGKSNFINGVICTLISLHPPEELRLVLVDLKEGVEFSAYEGVPHLHGKVVDDVSELANRLEELEAIMVERSRQMRGRAKNIIQFNAKYPQEAMPRIICIVDETASIMDQGDTTKRIQTSLRQLTAKGRSNGIHMLLSTQRPSVDAIPGNVKTNLAARIVGRMPSHTDSQTVLGSGDAKELAPIPGRMIYQIDSDPRSVQTPLIEEEDIADALRIAMTYPIPAPLPVPENASTGTHWTVESIAEQSIKFLNGNISHKAVWEEIKGEGNISYRQLKAMIEQIWKMDCILVDGKPYRMERRGGKVKRLVEIEQSDDSTVSQHPMAVETTPD